MASELQRERLRGDLGADEEALTDAEIDDAFARAEDQFGSNTAAVEAQTRVLVMGQLLAGAAKRADYRQNESGEKSAQVFEHLLRLRAIYEGDVQAAVGSAAAWGGLRRKPTRVEEYPDA